jgi:hypothetical protein
MNSSLFKGTAPFPLTTVPLKKFSPNDVPLNFVRTLHNLGPRVSLGPKLGFHLAQLGKLGDERTELFPLVIRGNVIRGNVVFGFLGKHH